MRTHSLEQAGPLVGTTPRSRVSYVALRDATPALLDEAWQLVRRYRDWSQESFRATAVRYSDMIVARDHGSGAIVGVSLMSLVRVGGGARMKIVFLSGFTVIERAYRGTNILQRAGLSRYLKERLRHPAADIYLMFMAGSYQSYLLLPRNFKTWWPAPGVVMPAEERALFNRVARDTYGEAWNAERGVLRHAELLRWQPDTFALDGAARRDAYVRYFLESVPGWRDCEALGCFTPLNLANWSRALLHWSKRIWRSSVHTSVE
jgi:hypothetical protein